MTARVRMVGQSLYWAMSDDETTDPLLKPLVPEGPEHEYVPPWLPFSMPYHRTFEDFDIDVDTTKIGLRRSGRA
jgi:hypothetical protein